MRLTGGVGAHVDDLALGAVNLVLVGSRQLGLDHDGVLRPGLQAGQQNSGVGVLVGPQLHVHHVPAVGAAAVLPLELCNVLIWPGRKGLIIHYQRGSSPKNQKYIFLFLPVVLLISLDSFGVSCLVLERFLPSL